MIYIKLHNSEDGVLLAMCDEELINKVIEDSDVYINVRDYSDFYKGSLVNGNEVKRLLPRKLHSADIIGNESIKTAVENSIIKKDNVKNANGIRYAHAYRIE